MKLNSKGFLSLETMLAIGLLGIIMSTGAFLLVSIFKNWNSGESQLEIQYNCIQTLYKLTDEIRESCGVEILDFSDNGWIKVYKSVDKTQFVTFRAKKDKLFIGFNDKLNSNSEFSNYVKTFKVGYLPEDIKELHKATGIKIYLEFEKNNKKFDVNSSIAFRFNYN